MRFMTRTLLGTLLICLTLGLLTLAAGSLYRAAQSEAEGGGRERGARERVFAVNTAPLVPVRATPSITTYGEVVSAKSLQLRTEIGGRIVDFSPNLVAGGRVAEGEVLIRLDPARVETALDLAVTEEAEAEAVLAEARGAVALAGDDVRAAEVQRDLRETALAR
ncbi:MAG: efflux transporter periplasmic adaptor subunit, partial [Pseudomonadota bacterium]